MNAMWSRLRTYFALGPVNVLRVAAYRASIRNPFSRIRRIHGEFLDGPIFSGPVSTPRDLDRPEGWWNCFRAFGVDRQRHFGDPPDWHTNCVSGESAADRRAERWWRIGDFSRELGDIKGFWEASRLDWAVAFAQRASAGDGEALERLNSWLNDWSRENQPYCGVNWKCGQEASIRVLHTALAAYFLEQNLRSSDALIRFVEVHLRRIVPTVRYAVAQNNNHGTSEGAALYVGGLLLAENGMAAGRRWSAYGRRILENRVSALFGECGSFSQYSTNYHRFVLDTLCVAEFWRRRTKEKRFSDRFYAAAGAATSWLRAMVDDATGHAPNTGANDSALLLNLSDADILDFRPSIQLAANLFLNKRAVQRRGHWDTAVEWLGLQSANESLEPEPAVRVFSDGGFAVLRQHAARVLMRFPMFAFRPSHADALHLDLWVDHRNVLRDCGTYSYYHNDDQIDRFSSVRGHNTAEFDHHDQMPKLGRFLYGDWLRTQDFQQTNGIEGVSFAASVIAKCGASHSRSITLSPSTLVVTDEVRGFHCACVMRWHLIPGDWVVSENTVACEPLDMAITVNADNANVRLEMTEGWESKHYSTKTEIPLLVVTVSEPCTVRTTISWST